MRTMTFASASLLVLTCAAVCAVVIGCTATVTAGDDVPFFAGSTVTVEVDPPICRLPVMEDNPPAGTCFKVTFLDSEGRPLGETEMTVGGPGAEAPEGTESIELSACDSPSGGDDSKPFQSDALSGAEELVTGGATLERHAYRLLPYGIQDGFGTYASYRVLARSRTRADLVSRAFVLGMLDEPPPRGVLPEGVVRASLLPNGDVLVEMFTTSAPQSLELRWNDDPAIGLGQAAVVASNGWDVTTVSIPAARVDASVLGATNRLEYEIALGERSVGTHIELRVEP